MRVSLLLLTFWIPNLVLEEAPRREADYVLVVSASNPVTAVKRRELARIFLKKVTRWQKGTDITPVDQSANAAVRASFTRDIMRTEGMGQLSSIMSYWQQQIYAGTGSPPEVKKSDAEVLAFVTAKPGAVGYVSATADLSGVKAVRIEE